MLEPEDGEIVETPSGALPGAQHFHLSGPVVESAHDAGAASSRSVASVHRLAAISAGEAGGPPKRPLSKPPPAATPEKRRRLNDGPGRLSVAASSQLAKPTAAAPAAGAASATPVASTKLARPRPAVAAAPAAAAAAAAAPAGLAKPKPAAAAAAALAGPKPAVPAGPVAADAKTAKATAAPAPPKAKSKKALARAAARPKTHAEQRVHTKQKKLNRKAGKAAVKWLQATQLVYVRPCPLAVVSAPYQPTLCQNGPSCMYGPVCSFAHGDAELSVWVQQWEREQMLKNLPHTLQAARVSAIKEFEQRYQRYAPIVTRNSEQLVEVEQKLRQLLNVRIAEATTSSVSMEEMHRVLAECEQHRQTIALLQDELRTARESWAQLFHGRGASLHDHPCSLPPSNEGGLLTPWPARDNNDADDMDIESPEQAAARASMLRQPRPVGERSKAELDALACLLAPATRHNSSQSEVACQTETLPCSTSLFSQSEDGTTSTDGSHDSLGKPVQSASQLAADCPWFDLIANGLTKVRAGIESRPVLAALTPTDASARADVAEPETDVLVGYLKAAAQQYAGVKRQLAEQLQRCERYKQHGQSQALAHDATVKRLLTESRERAAAAECLKQQLAAARHCCESQHGDAVADAVAEFRSLAEQRHKENDHEIARLTDENRKMHERVSALTADKTRLSDEAAKLEAKVKYNTGLLQRVSESLAAAKAAAAAAQAKVTAADERAQSAETRASAAEEKANAAEQRLVTMKQEVTRRVTAKFGQLQASMKEVQAKLAAAEERAASAEARLSAAEARAELSERALREETDSRAALVSQLQAEAGDAFAMAKAAEGIAASAVSRLAEVRQDLEGRISQVSELQDAVAAARREADATSTERATLLKRVDDLTKELAEVNAKTATATVGDDGTALLCSICLEQPIESMMTPCNHAMYCHRCATDWLVRQQDKPSCPHCRKKVRRAVRVYLPAGDNDVAAY